MGNHLLVLKANPNPNGKDYVIGDVHGGIDAFKKWLASIAKEDRGICAGDLVDRGEDSLGVILAIKEHNENENNGRVYAICGNHEILCLDAVKELEGHVKNLANGTTTVAALLKGNRSPITNYELGGGQWMLNLFEKEVSEKKIYSYYDEESNSEKVGYADDSDVKKVIDYFNSLPICIRVEEDFLNGKMPYNVVHADMPVNDNEIQLMIKEGRLQFDEAQINYATWARKFVANGRNKNSVLTLVGHNIVPLIIAHAVREDTNTVGVDFRSYFYKAIISVNVTDMKCQWFGVVDDKGMHPVDGCNDEFAAINQHLFKQKLLCRFLAEVKLCNSYDELEMVMDDNSGEIYTENSLLDLAIRHNALSEALIKEASITGFNLDTLCNAGFDYRYRFSDGMTLENFLENDDSVSALSRQILRKEKLLEIVRIKEAEVLHYIQSLDEVVRDKCSNDGELLQCLKNGKVPYDYTFQDGTSLLSVARENNCNTSANAILNEYISLAIASNNLEEIRLQFKKGVQLAAETLNGKPIFNFILDSICIKNWTDDHALALMSDPAREYNEPAKILSFVFDEMIGQLYEDPDASRKALAAFHERAFFIGEYVVVRPDDIMRLIQEIDAGLQGDAKSVPSVQELSVFSRPEKATQEDRDPEDKINVGKFNPGQ